MHKTDYNDQAIALALGLCGASPYVIARMLNIGVRTATSMIKMDKPGYQKTKAECRELGEKEFKRKYLTPYITFRYKQCNHGAKPLDLKDLHE